MKHLLLLVSLISLNIWAEDPYEISDPYFYNIVCEKDDTKLLNIQSGYITYINSPNGRGVYNEFDDYIYVQPCQDNAVFCGSIYKSSYVLWSKEILSFNYFKNGNLEITEGDDLKNPSVKSVTTSYEGVDCYNPFAKR